MLEKVKTFKGGYTFGRLKGIPKARIRHIGLPKTVTIPLRQGFGSEVLPTVKKGEKVRSGQIIGRDDSSTSSPVHSSVNGTVVNVISGVSGSGLDSSTHGPQSHAGAVVIEADGTLDWMRIEEYLPDIDHTTPEGIFKTLYMSGVSALGTSGIPTPHNSSPISPDQIKNIIVNGTNAEPFSLPVTALIEGGKKAFITGLKIINLIYPNADIDIALDSDKGEDIYSPYNTLSEEEHGRKGAFATGKLLRKVSIHPLKPKYPQGADPILVETILGEIQISKGDFVAIDYGIVILSVEDVIHIYEAVVEGRPLIEKIVSIGGPAYHVNHGISVRIGTSIKGIVTHRLKSGIEPRVVLNSMMACETQQDLDIPVTKSTRSIIALEEYRIREFESFLRPGIDRGSFSNTFLSVFFPSRERRNNTNLHGELRACIACNFCEYTCPVNILPFLISKYVTHNMEDETVGLNIFDCIECGLCSYVCPSKIPLLKDIQDGKQRLSPAVATSS